MNLPRLAAILIAALTLAPIARAAEPGAARKAALQSRAVAAMHDRDFDRARDDFQKLRSLDPTSAFTAYNLACACAMCGDHDAAVENLLDALSLGFVDFHHMARDAHLAPIANDPKLRTVLDNWRLLLDKRAEAELAAMQSFFGPEYDFTRDEANRVTWASAFEDTAFESAREEADRVIEWTRPLFPQPDPDDPRPHPWVTVILPSTPDFLRMVSAGNIGGFYDRDTKRLVSRDIGPSLRHEFFHALHWRHMDELAQRHPIWLQEGLACLLEDIDIAPDGRITIRPSWRTNIAKRLAQANRLTPWQRLFAMDNAQFMNRRPRATYAQARAVAMFLHEQGALPAWYRAYTENFETDELGLAAIETALGVPLDEAQRQYRKWLLDLEMVAEVDHPGASLGIALRQGAGEGPVVDEIVAMNPSGIGGDRGNRLRNRDIIIAIDGRTVRTLDDLHRVLGEFDPGDTVAVTVRRAKTVQDVNVTLVEPD